jgi:hypothetical protein
MIYERSLIHTQIMQKQTASHSRILNENFQIRCWKAKLKNDIIPDLCPLKRSS